ncbi:MAG TPA: hypothetical protein VGC58_01020 [Candidatus Paceibacterota bacterium]
MEGNNQNYKCDVCGTDSNKCGRCGHGCGFGRYSLLRWILGIIIITWVFSIGVSFGELKAKVEKSHGFGEVRVMPMSAGWSGGDQVYFTQASAQMMPR